MDIGTILGIFVGIGLVATAVFLGEGLAGFKPFLNYEAFQQPDSAERVRGLVERELIDFIIVDEIHYAKQRAVENISQRRQMVAAMTSLAENYVGLPLDVRLDAPLV